MVGDTASVTSEYMSTTVGSRATARLEQTRQWPGGPTRTARRVGRLPAPLVGRAEPGAGPVRRALLGGDLGPARPAAVPAAHHPVPERAPHLGRRRRAERTRGEIGRAHV